ncbi:hypothetical protein B0A50_08390 [Salinomyces thailandicus]|uniref:Uncharacterized protein n=1 Tax=Salinomyces thailandicus TaxID=706561 RepID=A0A4U0TLC4_9PEZI|nr:hypothetical protein B0A50_08390 [Salinomyces thailandica]
MWEGQTFAEALYILRFDRGAPAPMQEDAGYDGYGQMPPATPYGNGFGFGLGGNMGPPSPYVRPCRSSQWRDADFSRGTVQLELFLAHSEWMVTALPPSRG